MGFGVELPALGRDQDRMSADESGSVKAPVKKGMG